MTNEQLAILLRKISQHIRAVADDVGDTITDGKREMVQVWVGEGPEPSTIDAHIRLALSSLNSPVKNYAMRPEGRFVAVGMVERLADELDRDIDCLLRDDWAASTKAEE